VQTANVILLKGLKSLSVNIKASARTVWMYLSMHICNT